MNSTTPHLALLYALCPWASPSTCGLQASHFRNPIHSCWWLTNPRFHWTFWGWSLHLVLLCWCFLRGCENSNRRFEDHQNPSLTLVHCYCMCSWHSFSSVSLIACGNGWWSCKVIWLFIQWKKKKLGIFSPSVPVEKTARILLFTISCLWWVINFLRECSTDWQQQSLKWGSLKMRLCKL